MSLPLKAFHIFVNWILNMCINNLQHNVRINCLEINEIEEQCKDFFVNYQHLIPVDCRGHDDKISEDKKSMPKPS